MMMMMMMRVLMIRKKKREYVEPATVNIHEYQPGLFHASSDYGRGLMQSLVNNVFVEVILTSRSLYPFAIRPQRIKTSSRPSGWA